MSAPFASRRRLALVAVAVLAAALCLATLALGRGSDSHAARERAAPIRHFAGARIADFPFAYGAPGAIAAVPDPLGSGERVVRMSVADGDVKPLTPTGNPRAQLVSPDLIGPGDNVWLATRFLVPAAYPEIDPDGWVTLVEIYGPPFHGTSPWRLELVGDSLQWQRNSTYDFDTPFKRPLARGRWIGALLHERFGERGFVEMWIDGRPVGFFSRPGGRPAVRRLLMATMDHSNDEGLNSVRIGQYREAGMFDRGTIYFGPLAVGPTRASVAWAAR